MPVRTGSCAGSYQRTRLRFGERRLRHGPRGTRRRTDDPGSVRVRPTSRTPRRAADPVRARGRGEGPVRRLQPAAADQAAPRPARACWSTSATSTASTGSSRPTMRSGSAARATHRPILEDPTVRAGYPLLTDAAGGIGDPQVRNWGTIGGSCAHADPSSDWPAVLLATRASAGLPEQHRRADDRRERLLHRHVRDGHRADRAADRGPHPALAEGQRRRLRQDRAAGRRLLDGRLRGDGHDRRRRPRSPTRGSG